jgi:hypothetical protein
VNFIRLYDVPHDRLVPQEISKTLYVGRVEHIDFEVEFPSDMESVDRNSFA